MITVTGSKQIRSVVVPYRPGRKRLYICAVLALLALASALSYWLGGYAIKRDYLQLKAERELMIKELQESEATREEISQRLANASLGAEVDRNTVNEIRATVREHQQTIAGLNEEISFYKGLMAPTEREKGLGIRSWEVYSTNDPRRFQFKLTAQQLAHKHRLLKGSLSVRLVGQLLGEEEVIPLSSVSEQIEGQNMKLRFKYFQNFDGELQLPEGFEPQRVDIVAKATTPKAVQIERRYGWIVQQ